MLLKMEENKDKASIYFQNGCRYMELNQFQNAINEFDKLIRISPSVDAYKKKYKCLTMLGAYQSKKEQKKLVESEFIFSDLSNDFEDHDFIGRGKYKEENRDKKGAYEEYSNLIKYDPTNAEGYSLRGYLNLWSEVEDAKNDFKKALELDPNHARACYGYGSILCKFDEIKEGVKYFEKSAEIDPNALIFHEIGEKKLILGEKEDALEAFINAAELELKEDKYYCFYDNAIESFFEVVSLLMEKGEFNSAINYLKKIIEIRKKAQEEDFSPCEYDEEEQQGFYITIYEIKFIALCFYLMGDYENSINHLNKVIKYDWSSAESNLLFQSYILRGQALIKSNKVEEAYSDWEKVNCIEYIGNQIAILEHFEEYVFNSFAIKIEFKECREYFSKKINA